MKRILYLFSVLNIIFSFSFAQSDSILQNISTLPNNLFLKISRKSANLDEQITAKSEKYLGKLLKEEQRLRGKLFQKDSIAANSLFSGSMEKYQKMISKIRRTGDPNSNLSLQEYIPGIDSSQAAIRYIEKLGSNSQGFSASKLACIKSASFQLQALQEKLQTANEIDQFIKQREQQLKDGLSQYGFSKELMGINKAAFYYQQQLVEYKSLLHDPNKLEEKILNKLQDVPAFRDYLRNNSYLGQLFGIPDNYSSLSTLDGLQTRIQVEKLVSNNIGSKGSGGGPNPEQFSAQQIQQAQGLINQLKDKIRALGNPGGGGDLAMPDGFKKNDQKTKIFLRRIEYGFNIQAEPTTNFLPASVAIAGLVGYKINDRNSVGVGLSYRMGMGSGFNHIQLSNQGIGLRSYIDSKIKGNLYFTGGMEYNYLQEFKSLQNIPNIDIWQKSALFGLSKKTKLGKDKESKFQILFDALYRQHVPQSSPIVFRVGYQF